MSGDGINEELLAEALQEFPDNYWFDPSFWGDDLAGTVDFG